MLDELNSGLSRYETIKSKAVGELTSDQIRELPAKRDEVTLNHVNFNLFCRKRRLS